MKSLKSRRPPHQALACIFSLVSLHPLHLEVFQSQDNNVADKIVYP